MKHYSRMMVRRGNKRTGNQRFFLWGGVLSLGAVLVNAFLARWPNVLAHPVNEIDFGNRVYWLTPMFILFVLLFLTEKYRWFYLNLLLCVIFGVYVVAMIFYGSEFGSFLEDCLMVGATSLVVAIVVCVAGSPWRAIRKERGQT